MTTKTDSLVEKLVRVAAEIRNIEKGGRNTAQGYDFVTEADVVRKVVPALLAEGVLFLPRKREVVSVLPFTTAKGSSQFLTTSQATWVFTDGASEIEVMTIGQGTDAGDKGAYKGMTGDKKYAILQALGIATGDDPEQDSEQDKPAAKKTRKPVGRTAAGRAAINASLDKAADQADLDEEQDVVEIELASKKRRMFAVAKEAGYDLNDSDSKKEFQELVLETTGKHSSKQLTLRDVEKVIANLEGEADKVTAEAVAEAVGGEVVK